MSNHPSRPRAVYYTLNGQHRVVHRYGVYVLQRRRRGAGATVWMQLGGTIQDRDLAVGACSTWGDSCTFSGTLGWI